MNDTFDLRGGELHEEVFVLLTLKPLNMKKEATAPDTQAAPASGPSAAAIHPASAGRP